ncbi:MAG: hypothetical protein GX962_00975 [Epulopiscium sp.]|nr:hypothetical protein [Candidatus Epulonipiscium sp.]
MATRRTETLEKMRRNPRDWRYEQIHNLLLSFGFGFREGSKGSHVVFFHAELDEILSIPRARPIKQIYTKNVVKIIDSLLEKRGNGDGLQ